MANYKAIVSIVRKLSSQKGAPCKKTLQKIVFLIEAKELDLGCDYGIHFYGPYSSDLDFAIRELCDEGILDIQYTSLEHRVCAVDGTEEEAFNDPRIDEVINEFGRDTASELELLATALYVFSQLKDSSKIKEGVIKIKGGKYSDRRIDSAILRLIRTGYIAA